MSEYYIHHRLTFINGIEDKTFTPRYAAWLLQNNFKAIMSYESHKIMGEPVRPHLHVGIHTTFTNSHYVKLFRKAFPEVKGQQMHGTHVIEHEKLNDNYICKGYKDIITKEVVYPDIRFCNGYTIDYIRERHTEFWDINDNIQLNLIPAPLVQNETRTETTYMRVKPKLTWMQLIPTKCCTEYPEWRWDSSVDSKARIYRVVIRELGKSVKKISARIIRELCDGVQNALAAEDTENEFWSKVYPEEFHSVATGFFRDF